MLKFNGKYSILYILSFIIVGSLFLNLVIAGNPTPPTIPNMPINTSMINAKIGNQYLNISWKHIPTYNLSTKEFILKFSTNSTSAFPTLSGNNGGNFSLLLMDMTNLSTFNLSNVKVQYLVPYVKSQSFLYECSVFNNPTCTTVGQTITTGNSTNQTTTTCNYIGRANYTSYPVNYAYLKCNKTYTVNHYAFTNPTFPISSSQFSYLTNPNGTSKTGVFKLNELTDLPSNYKSNPKLNYREYKVTIYNVPIKRLSTGGMESTGTFAVNVNGKIFYDKTHSSWWNTTFLYKKPITVTETSGTTLTDYSVLMKIPYSANMNSDFSDLRFIGSDNITELGYWIENYTASTDAYVWIKIPSLLASSNTLIYMYYGNSGVTTTSNIGNAFLFGDDFTTDNSYNTTKWQYLSGGINNLGTYQSAVPPTIILAAGSYLRVSSAGLFGSSGIETTQNFSVNDIFEVKMKTNSNNRITGLFNWKGISGGSYSNGVFYNYESSNWESPYMGGTTITYDGLWATNPQKLYMQGITKSGISTTGSYATTGFSVPASNVPLSIAFDSFLTQSFSFYIYWVRIRNYVSSIPTYTIGTESGQTPTNSCTYSGTGNWDILSSDFCNITTSVDLGGNNITIIGQGTTNIQANITNWKHLIMKGINSTAIAKVICNGGCFK